MKETISKVKRQPSEWEKIIANEATDIQLIALKVGIIFDDNEEVNNQREKTYRWLTNT